MFHLKRSKGARINLSSREKRLKIFFFVNSILGRFRAWVNTSVVNVVIVLNLCRTDDWDKNVYERFKTFFPLLPRTRTNLSFDFEKCKTIKCVHDECIFSVSRGSPILTTFTCVQRWLTKKQLPFWYIWYQELLSGKLFKCNAVSADNMTIMTIFIGYLQIYKATLCP